MIEWAREQKPLAILLCHVTAIVFAVALVVIFFVFMNDLDTRPSILRCIAGAAFISLLALVPIGWAGIMSNFFKVLRSQSIPFGTGRIRMNPFYLLTDEYLTADGRKARSRLLFFVAASLLPHVIIWPIVLIFGLK